MIPRLGAVSAPSEAPWRTSQSCSRNAFREHDSSPQTRRRDLAAPPAFHPPRHSCYCYGALGGGRSGNEGSEKVPARRSETAQDAFKRTPRRPDALTPKTSRRFPRDRPNHVPGRRSGNMILRCRPAFERYVLLPRRPGGRPNHAPGTLSGNMIPHADPSPRSHRSSLPAPALSLLLL